MKNTTAPRRRGKRVSLWEDDRPEAAVLLVALVLPLGMRDMGGALAGKFGRALGLVLGAVVSLPLLAISLPAWSVIKLGRKLWGRA